MAIASRRAAVFAGHVIGVAASPGAGLQPAPSPSPTASGAAADDIDVDRVAYGFMASQALFAALDLGVFDHVAAANGEVTIETLQKLTGVKEPRLQTLVTALTAMKALRRSPQGRYTLSQNAAKFLVRSSKYFYGDYLRMQIGGQFYRHMTTLPDIVRTGRAPDYAQLFSDTAEADIYTRAQHNGSLATARQLCKVVDFSAARSMLDIGGGSGAFSIVVCRQHKRVMATVLELPEVCKAGRSFVAAEPNDVASRIRYIPGSCLDAWPAELGGGHDVVLISYVSESVPAASLPGLYRSSFERLRPGGIVVVHSFMVDDSMDGPELGALWSLTHVSVNAGGLGLHPAAVERLLRAAGFGEVTTQEMIGGMTKVMVGRKPL